MAIFVFRNEQARACSIGTAVSPNDRLIVLVKAPQPGQVKTRLAQTVGPEKACAAYQQLVTTLLHNLAGLSSLQLRFTPDHAQTEIQHWLQPGWIAQPQGEGSLGERLSNAFADAFTDGARRVAVIGSDCPDILPSDIHRAWNLLEDHDVVLGPAADGGYWLIGLNRCVPALFEGIEWSSNMVLGQTLDRVRRNRLTYQLLRSLRDVDSAADWEAFLRCRRGGGDAPQF